ncbi:MAG TPA: dienelactone hydrolase family protein [Acidobacteriota bacterium]|nr:dienelactone hydrolase family protein [Acidobacteriota bacterium]
MEKALTRKLVNIEVGTVVLQGDLTVPENALGLVLFAHGSGSSRLSPRNAFVAEVLNQGGLATLLFDLLTEQEDQTYANRFDIDLITTRLSGACSWASKQSEIRDLPVGYFGSSTGSAAALCSAAQAPETVRAVVSRGGRPDLVLECLSQVRAATLLIVGSNDRQVLELNEEAFRHLQCEKTLEIVQGAGHLFEEAGALETVARLARDWFVKHLGS